MLAIPDDALRRLSSHVEIRLHFVEPQETGLRVDENCSERLVDLMRDGRGKLFHRRERRARHSLGCLADHMPAGAASRMTTSGMFDRNATKDAGSLASNTPVTSWPRSDSRSMMMR